MEAKGQKENSDVVKVEGIPWGKGRGYARERRGG